MLDDSTHTSGEMRVLEMGINTHQELIVYMHKDCHICRAEGFSASTRLLVEAGQRQLIATLNIVENDSLQPGEIGLSNIARDTLRVQPDGRVIVRFAPVVKSLSAMRKKIYGHKLAADELLEIMADISEHKYRDIEIASFLSVCAGGRLDVDEIVSLTSAMVSCGKRIDWNSGGKIFDKHCIGGLPGNRTTPLVVAIVSAAGLTIPKTSSRAITSPAGTADTMEALFKVDFELEDMRRIVSETGACLIWGGAVNLSPADDLMIRIERALELDGEGQLIASVLSKKIAAGSSHVIIDIPVGDTAKVRSVAEADYLASLFHRVGLACGIQVRCVATDGSQPVGFGIGPVQEAHDVLAVLKGDASAPGDLKERAVVLSANLIDLAESSGIPDAKRKSVSLLESGAAWTQFQAIAEAQGGLRELPSAKYEKIHSSEKQGVVGSIDNRRLARLAKLAGAPFSKTAGLRLHAKVGSVVKNGHPLFTLFSESPGEMEYASQYYKENFDIFSIAEAVN